VEVLAVELVPRITWRVQVLAGLVQHIRLRLQPHRVEASLVIQGRTVQVFPLLRVFMVVTVVLVGCLTILAMLAQVVTGPQKVAEAAEAGRR
jgi:hypothetical protein